MNLWQNWHLLRTTKLTKNWAITELNIRSKADPWWIHIYIVLISCHNQLDFSIITFLLKGQILCILITKQAIGYFIFSSLEVNRPILISFTRVYSSIVTDIEVAKICPTGVSWTPLKQFVKEQAITDVYPFRHLFKQTKALFWEISISKIFYFKRIWAEHKQCYERGCYQKIVNFNY